jgi:hypothetical protein
MNVVKKKTVTKKSRNTLSSSSVSVVQPSVKALCTKNPGVNEFPMDNVNNQGISVSLPCIIWLKKTCCGKNDEVAENGHIKFFNF